MSRLTSAAGLIALLDEDEVDLKIYGLKCLNELAEQFWAELAEMSWKIESIYEDESFPQRELAALVVSKVYCYLGEFEDSINFLLGANSLFDINSKEQYVEVMLLKCIDAYIAARKKMINSSSGKDEIDPRLKAIIEGVFKNGFSEGEYKKVIGIAMESGRLDIIEQAILNGGSSHLLKYVMGLCLTTVENVNLRTQILRLLVKIYRNLEEPDWISISYCLLHLNDHEGCYGLLESLVDTQSVLMAYQVAFDLEENATQEFLSKIRTGIFAPQDSSKEVPESDLDERLEICKKISYILSGELSVRLYLEFLVKNNHADIAILKATKDALDSRDSAYHSAVTFANAMMNAGTTCDEFLCQSLEWLFRATNWTKFSATAALGIIHRGQLDRAMELLSPYLPRNGGSVSSYFEGGSLLALGFINANHGGRVVDYLQKFLETSKNEVILHGACLGIGVAAMASAKSSIYEALKNVLFMDRAITGGAAAYAMGLIMLGTASESAIADMLYYARETQHEKVSRGLALGIAMLMYGKEHLADALIDELCSDKDPIIRYGGVYTIALAYSGTGNNSAVSRLLRIAVSDVNDDIRRASVTSLGFLLFRTPEQVPRIVQLLSESYSPHLRYGATLALGIACAGTGLTEALDLLEPMTKDGVDYVRQGALIALSMILIQQNKQMCPRITTIKKLYEKIIEDKHEDTVAKFGAIISQGILDAGGMNSTISLQSRSGFLNMSAIVGMAIFTQFWYWYPLTHFLSLAFTPTVIIGLNKDLQLPKFTFISNAKPELFAYKAPSKPQIEEKIEKVATAVLSTTAKTIRRAKKLESQSREKKYTEVPEVQMKDANADESAKAQDEKLTQPMDTKEDAETLDSGDKNSKQKTRDKKKKQDASFQVLENLLRVVPSQLKYISFPKDSRYVPVKKEIVGGIIILEDTRPEEPSEILFLKPLDGSSAERS